MTRIENYRRHQARIALWVYLVIALILMLIGWYYTLTSFRDRADQISADYAAMSSQAEEILAELAEIRQELDHD